MNFRRRGFTLLEILISITGFFLMMTVVIVVYTSVLKSKYSLQAKTTLIENSYYMFEKINVMLKNYSLDYEEYFNRSMVGCNTPNVTGFIWNVGTGGYCTLFTAYGNNNTILPAGQTGYHTLYACSSVASNPTEYVYYGPYVSAGSGCVITGRQSYGEYAQQFVDVKTDVDSNPSFLGDSDDAQLGVGPNAIFFATGAKELYLISQDKNNRILIRRKLVHTGDFDQNGIVSGNYEYGYTLQILKLRGFDAGVRHNFAAASNSGMYDGKIDTWACDYAQGFVCHGNTIGNLYSGYALPSDVDDGWVDLFDANTSVALWNLTIFPTQDPELAWSTTAMQISPYITFSLKNVLYGEDWYKKLSSSFVDFEFALQTTLTTKSFYLK